MDAFSWEHKDCLVTGELVSFSYFGSEMLKRGTDAGTKLKTLQIRFRIDSPRIRHKNVSFCTCGPLRGHLASRRDGFDGILRLIAKNSL
jgi:hypothetical protein